MKTDGKEKLFRVDVDEAYPHLIVEEPSGYGCETTIPERLVKRLRDARAAEKEAADDIARWVKYSQDGAAKAMLSSVIEQLPTADERKAARKR